jgi:mediator of DNA damage checkpoint protein 1
LSGVTSLGGQWREGFTKDVTHMFCLSPNSDKYETAMEFQHLTGVKLLLPHWFDDVIKLGYAGLDTTPYEWPDPPLLEPTNSESKKQAKFDDTKRMLFKSATWDPIQGISQKIPDSNVWEGKRILLSDSFELSSERIQGLEQFIERGGGKIVKKKFGDINDEIAKVKQCDIYATRFRRGKAFATVSLIFILNCLGLEAQ